MGLQQSLEQWDGKTAAAIEDLYTRHAERPDLASDLVGMLSLVGAQVGASWMLKRHLENGAALDDALVSQVYASLDDLVEWPARLHVLQCLPHLPIAVEHADSLDEFVRRSIGDDNKFVRAWGYGALYRLGQEFEDRREEAERKLDEAMENEPASVKARIRNVRREGRRGSKR